MSGKVSNDSYEASENMKDNVVEAIEKVESGDLAGAAGAVMDAVGDIAQVAGHLVEGN